MTQQPAAPKNIPEKISLEADLQMKPFAERYVQLVLALGEHDGGYVDAYYGPQEWVLDAKQRQLTLSAIQTSAQELSESLRQITLASDASDMQRLRREYLLKQSSSIAARAQMLSGVEFTFDEESQALYDTTAPTFSVEYYQNLVQSLRNELPGSGGMEKRYREYQSQFVIPKDRLDAVFQAAIVESRSRTKKYVDLDEEESFRLEYVQDKVWSGYNWYQGKGSSLIQINTDLPIFIDRAVDLAAHEGYPGHHVYNSLLEKQLYRELGWCEYCVYPLYSPQSVIAEGTANYGIDVVFPHAERIAFERDTLFPLAGLDGGLAEEYYRIQGVMHQLNYANNDTARGYFSGELTKEEAEQRLQECMLYAPERAAQRLRFIEVNRAYVINYNWGEDLVKSFIERRMDDESLVSLEPHARRWKIFIELLSSPRLPSGLTS